LSGLVETVYKQHIADKTNWRAMLKGDVVDIDLRAVRDELAGQCADEIAALQDAHGLQSITALTDQSQVEIDYPVIEYPVKVTSFNLDKQPVVGGRLMGIKGQYLIFDGGVINLRKYGGYQLQLRQL
jgi:hypothetical protein